MTQKDLFPLFSPTCSLDGCVLLLTSRELVRLVNRPVTDTRMFLLVGAGRLSLRINEVAYEMKAHFFLDLLEGVRVEICDLSTDLQAWCLIPNYTFAKASLKNLRPGPDHYLIDRLHRPVLSLTDGQFEYLERQMEICISTKHLSRLVKEVLGKTPHEVICDELIKRATERLNDENISVSQIAEELHFSDQAAFCKSFKKHYAVSPMEYRRKLRMEH